MCCARALAKAGPQCNMDSAQVGRELWGLRAVNEKPHSAESESPWEKKSKARKSLFQSPPLDKIKSLDLLITQKKRKQNQARHELHQSLTQQLQGASDLEQVQSNGEEEEECRWPSRSRHPYFYHTSLGGDWRSFLDQHSMTWQQGLHGSVKLSPHPEVKSHHPQQPDPALCLPMWQHGTLGWRPHRELNSTSWCWCNCMQRDRLPWNFVSAQAAWWMLLTWYRYGRTKQRLDFLLNFDTNKDRRHTNGHLWGGQGIPQWC